MDSHIIIFVYWNRILQHCWLLLLNCFATPHISSYCSMSAERILSNGGRGICYSHCCFREYTDAVSLAWHSPSCICTLLSYQQTETYVCIILTAVLHSEGLESSQILTNITWTSRSFLCNSSSLHVSGCACIINCIQISGHNASPLKLRTPPVFTLPRGGKGLIGLGDTSSLCF